MNYVAVWFAAFFGLSAVDTLWHLGIFGRAYGPGFRLVAKTKDGKMALQPLPGLLSQSPHQGLDLAPHTARIRLGPHHRRAGRAFHRLAVPGRLAGC